MYNSISIAENIKQLSKEKNIPIKKLLEDCSVGKNTIFHMFNGSIPRSDTLAKIADYLDVSVDYLLGRTEYVDTVISASDKPESSANSDSNLTSQELELIKAYRNLNLDGQCKVLSVLYDEKYHI